jgi:putative multicomponent Na+:H+ antiporter subunit B
VRSLSALLIIAALLSIMMIKEKNNFNLIIYSSGFSLICASLYYKYNAPDLTLAEIAIGSALIPLIFIIAIGKQKEFIVLSYVEDEFIRNLEGAGCGRGCTILKNFCSHYDLKLKIYFAGNDKPLKQTGQKSADLIIEKCTQSNKYILKGKQSSILMLKLQMLVKDIEDIQVVGLEEHDIYA